MTTAEEQQALRVRFDDDPATLARLQADDYSTQVVPESGRVGRWQLTMSSWSVLSAMVWLFYGALVAGLYGTKQALIGIAISVLIYSIVTPIYARWAARTGLNSSLLSRQMFGVTGASLTALLLAATTTYYAVFESSTLAVALQSYTGRFDIKVWYLIVVVAMLPLMLGGVQSWMARLNGWLLPLYVVGLIASVIAAAIKHQSSVSWTSFPGIVPDAGRPVPGWLLVIVLYLGLALMAPVAVDFGRSSKAEDTKFHARFTFGGLFYVWVYGINAVVGIYLTQTMLPNPTVAEAGVVEAILAALGFAGLLFIIVTQTRINSLNYYLSSTNWDRFLRGLTGLRLPRLVWVIIVSAVVYLLMLTNVFSYLQTALTWQGIFMVGWVGIVGTHLALVPADRQLGPEFRAGRLPAFTPGLAVWFISAAVGIWLVQADGAPAKLAALAPAVVLVLSVALYATAVRLLPSGLKSTAADPRAEVDDPWLARVACDSCGHAYVVHGMDRTADGQILCDDCITSKSFNHPKTNQEVRA